MKRRQLPVPWTVRVAIAIVACALAVLAEWSRPDFIIRLDEGLRDTFLLLTADERPEERLVVVDISESSLREIGPWPWPRSQIADMVEILLGTYDARAVGLDIVFPEPKDAEGDARLASLAANAPLALAQIFDHTSRDERIVVGKPAGGLPPRAGVGSFPAFGHIANHAGLDGARCVGNIGYLPDADGVLRHIPARSRYGGLDYPHLAEALVACAGNHNGNKVAAGRAAALPANEAGLWRVPYSRALPAYAVVPAADILQGRVPHTLVAGRYVLVGSSSLGLGDRVSTPLAPLSTGVMVHAASLSGLLDLDEGRIGAPWSGRALLVAWSVLSIALAVGCIGRLPAWRGLLLLLGLVVCWLALAFGGFARQAEGSVTAPLWAYLFLLVVAIPYEWWQAQRTTRSLLTTLSHYVAHPVLDEILRLRLTHSLEPTLCDVTVLIADMEGYTRTTSSLSLHEAAALTKDFLDCLTRPVLARRGTLDKYSGDGLVAFWGAPLPCAEQADWAVAAGLDILTEVDAFNARRQRAGFAPVRVRIGIESGQALVGDLGTPFRSTYTAVGDCINFASRLEAAARDLPTPLLIGAAANRRLTALRTTSLGEITLRGTNSTIEIFTVASLLEDSPAPALAGVEEDASGGQGGY